MDYTAHGILQARILEWVPFPSPGDPPNPGIEPRSPAWQVDSLPAEPQESDSVSRSVMPDSVTPWTAAHQAHLSIEFSRQGYWSG